MERHWKGTQGCRWIRKRSSHSEWGDWCIRGGHCTKRRARLARGQGMGGCINYSRLIFPFWRFDVWWCQPHMICGSARSWKIRRVHWKIRWIKNWALQKNLEVISFVPKEVSTRKIFKYDLQPAGTCSKHNHHEAPSFLPKSQSILQSDHQHSTAKVKI